MTIYFNLVHINIHKGTNDKVLNKFLLQNISHFYFIEHYYQKHSFKKRINKNPLKMST